ncbi:Eukaryotic aspartyl protease [Musa troglodytarum]|uniref:Eukaryotic aspartyl protease n=1 Tax=Musa troglodytarum TaxID=320322 RepID=A0A9E7KFF4_9LILI|nr:Eukaryotic aspartyl protease [Musa troglodytarum]
MQNHTMFFLFLLICCSSFSSYSRATDYVKLPVFRQSPFPTAREALAFDSVRLSFFSSSSSISNASASHPPPPAALSVPVVSGASSGAGQYFVDLHLGTPPQRLRLVADTGSDLVWARCSACRDCSRHPPVTAFFPRHSSSFRPYHCYHPACRLVPHPRSSSHDAAPPCRRQPLHSPCRYRYSYADRSSSAGFFSRDIATLNSTSAGILRLHSLPFGCAFNVTSPAGSEAPRGVLGLGRGPISFPSRAARRFGDVFSYCLMDYTLSPPPTSFLLIGAAAHTTLAPKNLSFTPLLTNPLSPTFYYVRVLGVSVESEPLRVDPSVWALDRATGIGGTVVDSGTTLSFVPAKAYREIVRAMTGRLPLAAIVRGPPEFDLCVNASAEATKRVPRLAFRLLGGTELAPPAGNYFIDAADGVRCLAMQPVSAAGPGFGVIGNLMQQGFLLVFDRRAHRLGFSRTGCTDA